jgi:hypothetical protein
MGPFDDHQRVVSAAPRCRRSVWSAVCSSRSARVRRQFFAIVYQAWSPAEMNLLAKAANSALL